MNETLQQMKNLLKYMFCTPDLHCGNCGEHQDEVIFFPGVQTIRPMATFFRRDRTNYKPNNTAAIKIVLEIYCLTNLIKSDLLFSC